MHLIVYLHGFRSSPFSMKAKITHRAILDLKGEGVDVEWYCPQLPPSPKEAMAMVVTYIKSQNYDRLSIIGSSLGGYYGTYLAELFSAQATLLNPAIEPARDLESYIGELKAWHSDEAFHFKPEYIQELNDLYIKNITKPNRYYLIAAKGDEVLDWQEMVAKYPGAQQLVLEGGDHAISNYLELLPTVLAFHDLKSK
ncbi:MAG: hypothetical protein RLY99_729 [Pseudomonadota bacterium]